MSLADAAPWLSSFISSVKEVIFGEKNSRIDALLDYFFSLRGEKRAKITIGVILTLFCIVIFSISLYFWGLYNLQTKLNNAAFNIKELNNIEPGYLAINKEFSALTKTLSNTNQYSTIVSTLVQKTKELGIEISSVPERPPLIELTNTDPLFGQFQKVRISYEVQNISLRKIIDYVNAIEHMENKFEVTELEIEQKFETKLYFNLKLTLETYVPDQKNSSK